MSRIGLSQEGIKIVDLAIRKKGWTTKEVKWWRNANSSEPTLVRFQDGKNIEQPAFIALCKAVGIDNWEDIIDKTPLQRNNLTTKRNPETKTEFDDNLTIDFIAYDET